MFRAGVIIIFYLILYSSSPIFNFSHVAAASFVFLVYPVGQGDLNSFILYYYNPSHPHSKYTCRYLRIHTYRIISSSLLELKDTYTY